MSRQPAAYGALPRFFFLLWLERRIFPANVLVPLQHVAPKAPRAELAFCNFVSVLLSRLQRLENGFCLGFDRDYRSGIERDIFLLSALRQSFVIKLA